MKTNDGIKRQKILVVGNEPAILISLRTMLSVRTLHVIATDDPDAAIRLAQNVHAEIALALIDICTITMEPRELADRLRTERPGLKVLFFSSLVDGVVIRLGIVDPDGGVLRKDGVVKAIEEALYSRLPAEQPRALSAGAYQFHE
jgi:two-component system cell cycle sensor histidine kinase/response regulator CckA